MTEELIAVLSLTEELAEESEKIRIAASKGALAAREVAKQIIEGNLRLIPSLLKETK